MAVRGASAPIVLVHGSYHQPAHYDTLADRLGDGVTVPDVGMLPLAQSTALVQDIVDRAPTPPVVVGHSFGGAVAGAIRGARRIVFLSGWVLDVGETANGWLAQAGSDGGAEFMQALRVADDGARLWIDPAAAPGLFYDDCPPEATARAVGLLRPDTPANFDASPTAAQWKHTPTLYIATRRDHTWPPALAAEFAGRCDTVVTLDTGHSPFLAAPDRTAALLREAATT